MPEQSFMLLPCTVRVRCRLDRTPRTRSALGPGSMRHRPIETSLNHANTISRKSSGFFKKNRADSLARPGRIALKKCQKTLVHRKPSVKRLECYVWRFAKAFGKAITEKKGHEVASGPRLCGFEVEIEYDSGSCFPLKSDAMISPTHDS